MPRFKYTPLTSATDEIRLLSLDPHGGLDDIQCTLETHRLDSRPVYCALSYEWGDSNLPMDINVNGNVFQARHNLWLFLHRLKAARRSQGNISGPTSKLWIDALCIDQTNAAERSAQVQFMGRIYQEACGVIVWLGWSDGLDPNVTSTLANEISSDPIYGHESYIDLSLNGLYQQIEPKDDATIQEIYAFMLELCKKTYWTRRWIVQEILMAKRVLLVYGEQQLPWAALCMMFERCQTYFKMISESEVPDYYSTNSSTLDTILESTAARIWRHQNMRKRSNSGTSLANLLQDYRPMQCESVHDRVYALKGLTGNELLDTDYSISAPELYSRVFTTVLRQDRCAFQHWRDYAADCGLMVQPLGLSGVAIGVHGLVVQPFVLPDVTAEDCSNPLGAIVPLRTSTKDFVISRIDFATFQRVMDRLAGRPISSPTSSSTRTQDVVHEFWLRLGSHLPLHKLRFSSEQAAPRRLCAHTDVRKYLGQHAKLPMHSSNFYNGRTDILTTATKDSDSPEWSSRWATYRPTIMFCSVEASEELICLFITSSDAKSEDLLCHIFECCYLILRPNGESLQIVGPAWKLSKQARKLSKQLESELIKSLQSPLIVSSEDVDHLFSCSAESDSFFEIKDWLQGESEIMDVEVRFNVMEMIHLLQVTEQVMKNQHERSRLSLDEELERKWQWYRMRGIFLDVKSLIEAFQGDQEKAAIAAITCRLLKTNCVPIYHKVSNNVEAI